MNVVAWKKQKNPLPANPKNNRAAQIIIVLGTVFFLLDLLLKYLKIW